MAHIMLTAHTGSESDKQPGSLLHGITYLYNAPIVNLSRLGIQTYGP